MEEKSILNDAMINKNSSFHGNPLLKSSRENVALTKEHLIELKKCSEDPIYFAEHYAKIIDIDKGLIPVQLYPYQRDIINGLKDNRMNIILSCRQSGKCVGYDTVVTMKSRNIYNGKEFDIKIGDFYNWVHLRKMVKKMSAS